jgi:hypothetical protein
LFLALWSIQILIATLRAFALMKYCQSYNLSLVLREVQLQFLSWNCILCDYQITLSPWCLIVHGVLKSLNGDTLDLGAVYVCKPLLNLVRMLPTGN